MYTGTVRSRNGRSNGTTSIYASTFVRGTRVSPGSVGTTTAVQIKFELPVIRKLTTSVVSRVGLCQQGGGASPGRSPAWAGKSGTVPGTVPDRSCLPSRRTLTLIVGSCQ